MKPLLVNAACVACLSALAVLQFGWVFFPALGTVAALLNAAFVLACLAVYAVRTNDDSHLQAFLQRRVRDGVLLRLIGKWLNAGVLEDGCVTHSEQGSPQGGVVSPLLSNLFLHYVLDDWFEPEVQLRLKGESFLIRYADDFVMGFSCEEDARRVLAVLPKRFAKHGLLCPQCWNKNSG